MARYVEKAGLVDGLRRKDFSAFARGYNGSAFARYSYHTKMAAAYRRISGKVPVSAATGMLRMGSKGARVLRMGWYRPVHAKSGDAQEVRALLVGRKLLQAKLLDVELSIRGILRGYGLKVGEVSRGRFEARIRDLIEGHDMLGTVIGAMLQARAALWNEFTRLHRAMLKIARADPVCQRLMSAPGVGALVALTYRAAVDDPGRFAKSRTVGAYFGLTPKKYQSGETDIDGGITRVGDAMVRTALYEAAHIMLTRASRFSALKRWAMDVAKRRGMKRAKVALARKLATVLHRMWVDASAFRWSKEIVTA